MIERRLRLNRSPMPVTGMLWVTRSFNWLDAEVK
jgi:hypothetical protein